MDNRFCQDKIIKQALFIYAKPLTKREIFLKERYEGGKAKVPNTNPATKQNIPLVSFNTLYNNDPLFRDKIQKEFEQWLSENPDASGDSEDNPKSPDKSKKDIPQEESKKDLNLKFQDKESIDKEKKKISEHLDKSFKSKKIQNVISSWEKVDKSDDVAVSDFWGEQAVSFLPLYLEYRKENYDPEVNKNMDTVLKHWVSNSNIKPSWRLHNFATKLGFKGSKFFGLDKSIAERENWISDVNDLDNDSFMGAYNFQQVLFEKLGLTHINLYRGISSKASIGQKVSAESRPCASTTNNLAVTKKFGNTLLQYKVPVENILLSPFISKTISRQSALSEDEYVVMGLSDITAEVKSKH